MCCAAHNKPLADTAAGLYTSLGRGLVPFPDRMDMFESVQKRVAAIAHDGRKVRRLILSCKKLLSERGEAAGVSLAKVTLDLYRTLERTEQARFFAALLAEFSPDPTRVLAASQTYAADPSAANLAQLSVAAEPPRQEVLRR